MTSTNTIELKEAMEKIERERRDRPAKHLITTGSILGAIGGLGLAAILAIALSGPAELGDTKEIVITIISGSCLLLGGVLFGCGQILRYNRRANDDLRDEVRDARPADTIVLAQLFAAHEATQGRLDMVRASVELGTGQILTQAAHMTDQGAKRFEEIHDFLTTWKKESGELIRSVVREEIEKVLADLYVDALDAATNGRGRLVAVPRKPTRPGS